MIAIILADTILVLVLGVPVYIACRKWGDWVNRMSDRLRPFERHKRFGLRSWVSRSFVLKTPADEVLRQTDELTEKDWPVSAESDDISALGPMLGRTKFHTGIDIEWLDKQTAEFRARQHAEWPAIAEDNVRLPMKQRQRLAERVIFHVEPMAGGKSRVSYELQFPGWLILTSVAVFLLVLWITWGLSALQGNELYVRIMQDHGIQPQWLVWNTAVVWALAAWTITYAIRLLRLQNISLLDNLITAFEGTSSRR